MAHKQVVDTVRAHLTEYWTDSTVNYPNEIGNNMGDAFVAVQFPFSTTERLFVSDTLYREEGGVRLILNMVRGEGAEVPLQWAEDLAALFRDESIGGVHFGAPTSPYMDDTNDQGNYYQVAVVVPYWFQYRKVE